MKADTEDEVRRLAGLFGVDDENSIELVQQLIDEKWIEEIQGAQEGVAIESFVAKRGMSSLRKARVSDPAV